MPKQHKPAAQQTTTLQNALLRPRQAPRSSRASQASSRGRHDAHASSGDEPRGDGSTTDRFEASPVVTQTLKSRFANLKSEEKAAGTCGESPQAGVTVVSECRAPIAVSSALLFR